MRRLSRCICIMLVVILVLANTVSASEVADSRASYYFSRYTAYLYKTSTNQFQIWFDVTAVGTMDELGVSSIKVQRSSDNATWTTMKTYYPSSYSQMIRYNAYTNENYVTYTGSTGYYYRAYVTFYAKEGTGEGTRTGYTSSLYLPVP